jgi:hypothetical protein
MEINIVIATTAPVYEVQVGLPGGGVEAVNVDGVTIVGSGTEEDPYAVADGKFVDSPATALATLPADTAYFPIFTTLWLRFTWAKLKEWLSTLYAPLLIQFGREITEATTIQTTDLYKLTYINSASTVPIEVDNMPVGAWIPFDTLGAGLPEFQIAATNIFPDEDFTGATSFILLRKEDDGANAVYDVKYK